MIFPRAWGRSLQILMCGRVKGRLPLADGRICIGASLGGTMMQTACRVPCSHGALRVSALPLVTLGSQSNRQSLLLQAIKQTKNGRVSPAVKFLIC